jgi:adenosylcobinamide-phosphate synthase
MMFFELSLQAIAMSTFIAVILDLIFSEVKCFHPLVGFGYLSNLVEKRLNTIQTNKKLWGCFSLFVCMTPLFFIIFLLNTIKAEFLSDTLSIILDGIILYFVIGHQSLKLHALNIFNPLNQKTDRSLKDARKQIGMIVSRETKQLTEQDINRATVESVLENGHDAVIASLFWYTIGGIPFAILHRLVNTLDAMWGYKNKRFVDFG